jgi:rubrerythrin
MSELSPSDHLALKGRGSRKKINHRRIIMPDFQSPFSGLARDRKLTNEELIRAVRFVLAGEYEATQMYMQLAESTDNKLAIKVLKDIADEERVHAGEFLRLLYELAPDEKKFYAEGAKEVEEEIEKLK